MKKTLCRLVFAIALAPFVNAANAGFPNDLSDVQFIEASYVKSWPIGAGLSVSIGGGNISMPYGGANSWPSVRPSSLGGAAVNANAWGIVNVGGTWYAGTWEYLRPGQTTKKLSAFGGCCHFRPPINNFRLSGSQLYGVFISGVVRDTSGGINVTQRTNFVVFNGGGTIVGQEGAAPPAPEPEPEIPHPSGAIDLLLDDGKGKAS